jgi:hypothetical protein
LLAARFSLVVPGGAEIEIAMADKLGGEAHTVFGAMRVIVLMALGIALLA